ncbi:MAG: hypothetical protein ACXWF2_12000 [Usitatibacter sp.]
MTRRIRRSAAALNSLLAWQALGLRVAETMLASTQVIAHRTRRRNEPAQLFEMGNEKVQAAMESSHALARQWMSLSRRSPAALWTAWPNVLASGLAPFHARATKNARRATRAR